MKYTPYPKLNREVSVVGVGCWGLGGQYGPVDRQTACATLEKALDLGINFFDTADAYGVEMGTSERIVGDVLSSRRDEVVIASKVGNWGRRFGHPLPYTHPVHIYGCCDASLGRMKTDYIDLYQCHIGNIEDPEIFIEAFEKLLEQGKIRAYGISTNSLEVMRKFNANGKSAVCQLDYSILNRSPEEDLLPYCRENNVGVLVRGPLAQGLLSGKYTSETVFTDQVREKFNPGQGQHDHFLSMMRIVDQLRELETPDQSLTDMALRYCLAHPAVTVIIPGAKSPGQIEEHVKAASAELDSATVEKIRGMNQ